MKNKITIIEDYVKTFPQKEAGHNFLHVDRVRRWALKIAKSEKFEKPEQIETAALLHDIGLSNLAKRQNHGKVGAELARKFLTKNKLFSPGEIEEIAEAISYHNTITKNIGPLGEILRDADIIDLLGAVGILRGISSRHFFPEYQPNKIKGVAFKKPSAYFDPRFKKGQLPADYMTDEINFQASCYENLSTPTAKKIAKPLVKYMYDYLIQLEKEIK